MKFMCKNPKLNFYFFVSSIESDGSFVLKCWN